MEPPLPRPPDGDRRRKRRELDARRSKCRIRLGGHLEQWCRLKEQLGFALHSQLAKFLLDRYSSQGCAVSAASRPADPNLLHADADALQRLVALSHGHSRECGFIPDVKPPAPGSLAPLVWECVAGHRFSWGGPSAGDAPQRCDGAGGGSERGSPPVPVRRRSLRRTGVVVEPMVEEPSAVKDDAVWSPGGGGDGGGDGAPQGQMEAETAAQDHESSTPGLEEKADGHAVPQEEEEEEDEDFAEEDDLTYTDDLRDENYHPSQDSDSEPQRRQSQPHTRKKPVKEEQTPNEQNPMDSSSAEEKGGQARCPDAAGTRGRLSKQSLPVEVNAQMAFTSGCNHPSFTLPWRTLLPYLVALHLLQPGSAQSTVVAPSLRVTANVGQDVVLCCHLSPCKDVRNSDIRWIQQRSSRLVHHYRNGVDLGQMEEYKGRTELLRDGLSDGNLDLRITAVTSSDSGSYSCAVQDGDAYAEAVVNLEVSDPFSMIILYWTVALAVIITLLVGSFVVNVFLHRKKVAQSRELKRKDAELVEKAAALERKDAELAEQAALSKQRDAMLEKHVLKLEEKTDEVENWNSVLKKDSEEMGYGFAELKKLAAELEKHSEEMGTRDLKLERLAAKLEHQTKELEKQHSQFQRHFQNMYLSAGKQKKMVTKLEEHCEWMVRRNVKLEAAAVKVGHKAKESEKQKSELKERHEEMAEQTEAVVVETEE